MKSYTIKIFLVYRIGHQEKEYVQNRSPEVRARVAISLDKII